MQRAEVVVFRDEDHGRADIIIYTPERVEEEKVEEVEADIEESDDDSSVDEGEEDDSDKPTTQPTSQPSTQPTTQPAIVNLLHNLLHSQQLNPRHSRTNHLQPSQARRMNEIKYLKGGCGYS